MLHSCCTSVTGTVKGVNDFKKRKDKIKIPAVEILMLLHGLHNWNLCPCGVL